VDWFRCRVLVDTIAFGGSMSVGAVAAGMSRATARKWWQRAVGLPIRCGRQGGIAAPLARWSAIAAAVAVAASTRRRRPLTLLDREVIAIRHAAKASPAAIGRELGRHRSVISRELRRNSGPDGSYFGSVAAVRARDRARRPKPFKLTDPVLAGRVTAWLEDGWSPHLIAEVLAADHPDEQTRRVSHETIYQALYVQTRGSLRADLARHLSTRRTSRKTRTATRRGTSIYANAFTISQRPAEVEDRAVPGHWEGDLILGAGNQSAIGTLVERSTRFTILLHLPGRHDAETVADAMITAMADLPEHLRRSITWDRGVELADYARIQLALKAPVFFCDPHSPWQRGSNENTNRLLRHWFEKGTDLSTWTAADVARVQDSLNARPRPTLGLKSPAQALNEHLQAAA
jgi:IS30 family transposase